MQSLRTINRAQAIIHITAPSATPCQRGLRPSEYPTLGSAQRHGPERLVWILATEFEDDFGHPLASQLLRPGANGFSAVYAHLCRIERGSQFRKFVRFGNDRTKGHDGTVSSPGGASTSTNRSSVDGRT
jgi:hypothetical protein